MPMYDFKCVQCKHIQEELISIDERNKVDVRCSNCGNPKMVLRISAPHVKFRGSGFHVTDYNKIGPKVR